ncbi:MAG: ECF transporter S component [Eubacteriales bacterium]|nr:ECF transporter S component [Eubacteriales bacterium]
MNTSKTFDTRKLVEIAVLIAVTIIMGTTPLGTIRTPFLSVSLVTIPVAIAAIIIGPLGGTICGAAFGITSFINAVTGTSGMMAVLFGVNPFGVFFTAVVPRVLEGLLVGLIFKALHSGLKLHKSSYYIASICCPLLNTLLFMTCIVVFFYNSDYIQGLVSNLGVTNPFAFVVALVGVQGLIEAVCCMLIAGTITITLAKVLHR